MSKWDRAQICVSYRCNTCEVDDEKFTCDDILLTKQKICDGTPDCPLGQDENCYRIRSKISDLKPTLKLKKTFHIMTFFQIF